MSGKDWSMHIVREEHWAANQSHVHMVEVSAGQKSKHLLSLFSRYGCPKLRSIKNEKSNAIDHLGPLYRRQGGTPL